MKVWHRYLAFAVGTSGMIFCSAVSANPTWAPTAQSVRWTGEIVVDQLDCAQRGADGIVISGQVVLRHPGANTGQPSVIKVICPNLLFEAGSEIRVTDDFRVRITGLVLGPARITSSRGQAGKNAFLTPEIWAVSTARSGVQGGNGRNGKSARSDLQGNWDAERGGDGGHGAHGDHGKDGGTGAHGNGGTAAAPLQLRAASFAAGATLHMSAIGGAGGIGGKGGRGIDGGRGGNGGQGGRGGDGNTFHDGDSGGNGGNGGDGGNGGNGGQGGNGGPGGNGANVFLYILEGGKFPVDIHLAADGGLGGRPGEGGDGGIGGDGGEGGLAGCGGKGGTFIGVRVNADGSCGTNGHPGVRGKDGRKGPPGVWGEDGKPGNIGKIDQGFVKPADF